MTTIHIDEFLKETDKAIFVSVHVATSRGAATRTFWLPKSKIENRDGYMMDIPEWLADAKVREINEAGFGRVFDFILR